MRTSFFSFSSLKVGLPVGLLVAFLGCATIGDETAFPDAVVSGIAPFRNLTVDDTGTPGIALIPSGGAFGRGMRTANAYWYTHATELTEPPMRDESLPEYMEDWAQFEPRVIRRSASDAPTRYGFDPGDIVFQADADWQGGAVFDPWAIENADGTVRLYFAGAGGIGYVDGPAGGPFDNSVMVLENARAPSVVTYGGETWMFFERNGRIGLATSTDGNSFAIRTETLDFPALERDEDDPMELSHHSPGAYVYTSPIGRESVRLYFEGRFDDDTTAVGAVATMDGESFDRWTRSVFGGNTITGANGRHPAPYWEGPGNPAFLYATRDASRGATSEPVAGVSPASTVLVETPEE